MSLSAEKIQSNYKKHFKIIDTYLGDRKDSVKDMLKHMEEIYIMAPASGKTWFHNAFAGGYVDHVNRVVEYAVKRMERSFDAVRDLVERLDQQSLRARREITVPLVRQVFLMSDSDGH